MIYQVINAFKEAALRNKAVNTFKYEDKINLQPNNNHYSVTIETDGLFESLIRSNNHTLTINMTVLSNVEEDEVTTQDIASQVGLSIINKVVEDNKSIMSLNSYSILLFTKKTDDVCSGARFTIQLTVPSFIDYCTEPDYFLSDAEYEAKLEAMKDAPLDLGDHKSEGSLDLKPLWMH